MMRKGIPGTRTGMTVVAIAAAIVGVSACKKENAGGDQGAAPAAAAPPKPVAWKTLKLDKLGIEVKAPGNTAVLDRGGGDAPNVTLTSNECDVMIDTVTDLHHSTFAAAKSGIQHDANTFQKFTHEEKTAKGWYLAFEAQDMIEKKPLYGVEIRTTVGAKQFECSRNDADPAKIACVTKVCQSIQKPGT
jgi:hypothetical protein